MSEYTRQEILKMIEENGGSKGLDLSGADLSGIDLGEMPMSLEREKYQMEHPGQIPVWYSQSTGGIDLHNANLDRANLSGASLVRACLQEAYLTDANLQKAHLASASLLKASLSGANLQETILVGATLQEANLLIANLQEAGLESANLQGAELVWANFQEANLRNVNLNKASLNMANLQNAKLWRANMEEANLTEANLQEAYLVRAKLRKAKLQGAHLERVDMYDVKSLGGAYFCGAFLDQTRMRKEQLGGKIGEEIEREYYAAKEAYLLLKNNFNQIGRYDDASWAYVKERQMEKKTHWPLSYALKCYGEGELPKEYGTWSRRVDLLRFYLRHLRLFITDWITELLCLYGESPLRVLAWAAAFAFLIFPLLYVLFGGVATADGSPAAWSEYLRLSLASFATIELANIEAQGIAAQFLRTLEALTGVSLLALLMFTLGNRISRS